MSSTLGWSVGFWGLELISPSHDFKEIGYQITIASPKGGKVKKDALSDPRDESGYSAWDELSLEYLENESFGDKFKDTTAVSDLNVNEYNAITQGEGREILHLKY